MVARWNIIRGVRAMSVGLLAGLVSHAVAAADVKVEFSDFLAERMGRISAIEKEHEEFFREYRAEGRRQPSISVQKNKNRFLDAEWGNERLVEDVRAYSVPALAQAMMEHGIKEAKPDFDGRIVLHIDRMKVANFSLSVLRASRSQIRGTVDVFDAAGNLVATHKVSKTLLPKYTQSRKYTGPDYAYLAPAAGLRVGPVLAQFTEEALEKVFPGYDAPSAILVRG